MTRPEIIIEGSDDRQNWREYVFRYKPGPLDRRPSWNIPYQPRLDWQMWFAGYGKFAENPWFRRLDAEIARGQPTCAFIVGPGPFADRPPKYVRAQLFDYQFADPDTPAQTGGWWIRRPRGLYFPGDEPRGNATIEVSVLTPRSSAW